MEDLIYLYSCKKFDFVDKNTGNRVSGVTFNGFDSNLYPVKFSISQSKIGSNYEQLIQMLNDILISVKNNGISEFTTVTIRPFYNRFGKVSTFEFV